MTFVVVRDPLWNNIRLDATAVRLVDTPPFQRLRYVRQLGLAYLVYPGATHSRFEHALGAHHLAGTALTILAERGELEQVPREEREIVRAAALLHDIGHYPYSHALEEIGVPHHEEVAWPLLCEGEVGDVLRDRLGADAPQRIWELVRGVSRSPLQGLISGSLDLDKIEYLKRDALMCGVPYGEIDVDRLLNSLVIVDEPGVDPAVGVLEKGLSALESLLFAKYQMYRNVYWHHAVRSATAMYKRMVADALRVGAFRGESLTSQTDEGLIHLMDTVAPSPLLDALRGRRLYKRAFEVPAAELHGDAGEWIADDPAFTAAIEDRLCDELGLAPAELLLDYPAKTQMLGVDISVQTRSGDVAKLAPEGLRGSINLPALSDRLYRSARWLRIFVARRLDTPPERFLPLFTRPKEELAQSLERGSSLLD